MANDPFATDHNEVPALDPDKDYFEELVGEGKKYADQKAAGKALAEKDRFIAQLLQEQNELRGTLNKRINEQEFLDRLEQLSKQKSPEPDKQPPADGTRTAEPALTPEKIEEIIDRRETEKVRRSNLDNAIGRLKEVFGDDYRRRVQEQASALGVGTDFLTSVAQENPQAFYRLMNLDEKKARNDGDAFAPPPRSQVTTPLRSDANAKDYAYYQNLLREKGEAYYFQPKIQLEMFKSRNELGEERFYKKK